MVTKLWDYFVGEPIPGSTLAVLERGYVAGGFETRPLVEAILRHPLFYEGPRMVIPPAVYCAGLLRALGQTVQSSAWSWIGVQAGQKLFEPPNVAGWDYTRWLDTSRWAGRLTAVNYALDDAVLDANTDSGYTDRETPSQALASALAHWGDPELSDETRHHLLQFSRRAGHLIHFDWQRVADRVLRQNALRALIPTTPELQTC